MSLFLSPLLICSGCTLPDDDTFFGKEPESAALGITLRPLPGKYAIEVLNSGESVGRYVEGILWTVLGDKEQAWTPEGGWHRTRENRFSINLKSGAEECRMILSPETHSIRLAVSFSQSTLARFLRFRLRLPGLARIFNPEPSWTYELESPASEERRQDILDSPGRYGGDWIFTPPPFVYAVKARDKWLSLGLDAQKGRLDFLAFTLKGNPPALLAEIDFGRRRDLSRPLPDMLLHFTDGDAYAALDCHLKRYRYRRSFDLPLGPLWWRQPIFCGWGEQLVRAKLMKLEGRQAEFCRQENYDLFRRQLEVRGLKIGILTIDDKWQKTYGGLEVDTEKWPDMRRFVEQCHVRGIRVLLWLPLWHPEGLPASWCIPRNGNPYKADPRNPEYLKHLQSRIHFLLSPDGMNADGLKVDWTNQGPWDLTDHADEVWGMEMLRQYHAAIYRAAKLAKPRALVVTHTFHPAFLSCTDMLRLNDIMPWAKDVVRIMRHRARMARLLDETLPVDCDNCSMPTREEWLNAMKTQPELGVPCLYFLTHLDGSMERIREEDWEVVRDVWNRYRERLVR